jgi:hypothetical protein
MKPPSNPAWLNHREWAYSANTRHRISAHFYLTAPEPGRLAIPERDPLERIVATLGRSTAKTLALDTTSESVPALQAAPSDELRQRREVLVELLATYPARTVQEHDWHQRQLADAQRQLTGSRQRLDELAARLDTVDPRERPGVEHDRPRARHPPRMGDRSREAHRGARLPPKRSVSGMAWPTGARCP